MWCQRAPSRSHGQRHHELPAGHVLKTAKTRNDLRLTEIKFYVLKLFEMICFLSSISINICE